MKRFKHIINEVKSLEKYEVHKDIIKYLRDEFGLHVDIEIFMNYVDIYVSHLRDDNTDIKEIKEDTVSKAIKTFFNKQDYNRKAEAVWVTEYGYTVILESDIDIFEEKLKQENALYYYYYNDIIDEHNETNKLLSSRTPVTEAKEDKDLGSEDTIDKETIGAETSNIVLDTKFVWFFNVLDSKETIIEEDLLELEDAIDTLIDRDAAMIVALPYVDPAPDNDDVDLVFADNPGPVIVYDGR